METRPCSIKYIDLHHTAGNEASLGVIRNEHMKNNGWGDIGYNAVVFPDGTIPKITNSDGSCATGRSLKWSGAHNPGKAPDGSGYTMNQKAYGLSHVGNFETGTMPDVQFAASTKFCAELCKELNIVPSTSTIRRHSDDYATACPGKNFPYEKYVKKVIEIYNGEDKKKVEYGILLYSGDDFPIALRLCRKYKMECAIFIRDEDTHKAPEISEKVKTLFIVGGTSIGHSGEVLLGGDNWFETAEKVGKHLKAI
ncbi:N-acetylmuramoyl-L-alanine amidase family 2 [Syntrophobotulus glycolicus DSM 8271]|uniref:N-acetylmuramoyl-L-alanine amidase family 2 n=1 Tax=Syntrophobotulus glycolicus (strain DSM 8271 / FlGlyR) TaxID=645991 RepID=F0SXI3_SYNGF|nr:peptidoglycan recognition family protein [Syntrophobotulus glycolicus]ADY54729.1 N-acetylmuramoyl-L-alanine amidase family 2 [Syntrophobotulus glycolicus DSM 8271]